jgi:predicted PurR-regulated permease PerM
MNRAKIIIITNTIVLVIIAVLVFLVRQSLLDVAVPFGIAIVIAYFMNPLMKYFEKKNINRILSIFFSMIIFIGVLVILGFIIGPTVVSSFQSFIKSFPSLINELNDFTDNATSFIYSMLPKELYSYYEQGMSYFDINDQISTIVDTVFSMISNMFASVMSLFSSLVYVVVIPVLIFFFLKDKEFFSDSIIYYIPIKLRDDAKKMFKEMDYFISHYIRGQILVALITGIEAGLGCYIIGIPYAAVIGVVTGVTNFIPFFGPIIGGTIAVFISLLTEPINALYVLILIIVIQQIDGNIVTPLVMANAVGFHPLVVMLSVFFMGEVMGILGMLLAIPIIGVVMIFLKYIVNGIARKKGDKDYLLIEKLE